MPVVHLMVWAVTPGLLLVVALGLRTAMARAGLAALGPANRVTLVRAVLVCVVGGLVAQSVVFGGSVAVLVTTATVAVLLDAVDGWVARRTGSVSSLGARFDLETDALLILLLSIEVAASHGPGVLLIGAARYLLWVAQCAWPRLRSPIRARRWRKVVAAAQAVTLLVVATGLLPAVAAMLLLVASGALLFLSFATEVVERTVPAAAGLVRRSRGALWSALSLVVVWTALAAPAQATAPSGWLVLRVPLEGLLFVGVALLLPARASRLVAAGFGTLAGLLAVLKALNVGFTDTLDRPFSLLGDWGYLPSAVGVLADTVGRPLAVAAAVALGCAVVVTLVLLPLAAMRVAAVVRRRRRQSTQVVAGLGVVALLLTLTAPHSAGADLTDSSAALAVDQVVQLRADLHDHAVFALQIEHDPFAGARAPSLLARLRGQDVLLVFVESYGRVALQGPAARSVRAELDAGTRALRRAGYASASGFLTSPTFGGLSWLAHSTLQSGLWVDSQLRYDELLSARRLTLSSAFRRAGWRTVSDVPSDTERWPEGARFYGFDAMYDAGNVGYHGPRFGYARMPDQYTLQHLVGTELAPVHRRRVMAEVDLVSSHYPWAPLPRMVPPARVGDGSVYRGMPATGDTAAQVLGSPTLVRAAYQQSIRYSLQSLVSMLASVRDRHLVVVMLGDHQPHQDVSGTRSGHDVPVSIIARDPRVLRPISGWGWQEGLRPRPDAPLWRMDAFRDRFLTAFSDVAPRG